MDHRLLPLEPIRRDRSGATGAWRPPCSEPSGVWPASRSGSGPAWWWGRAATPVAPPAPGPCSRASHGDPGAELDPGADDALAQPVRPPGAPGLPGGGRATCGRASAPRSTCTAIRSRRRTRTWTGSKPATRSVCGATPPSSWSWGVARAPAPSTRRWSAPHPRCRRGGGSAPVAGDPVGDGARPHRRGPHRPGPPGRGRLGAPHRLHRPHARGARGRGHLPSPGRAPWARRRSWRGGSRPSWCRCPPRRRTTRPTTPGLWTTTARPWRCPSRTRHPSACGRSS
jgi:hypothetical protein